MKALFILLLFTNICIHSQNSFYENDREHVFQSSCVQDNPSNGYEDGIGFDIARGYTTANDIIIPQGEDLTLNQISLIDFLKLA